MGKYDKLKKQKSSTRPALPKPNIAEMSQLIKYSFKYVDQQNACFFPNFGDYDSNYLINLVNRLKSISHLTMTELLTNRSSALRAHPINWDGTSQTNGFTHMRIEIETPYQFELTAN